MTSVEFARQHELGTRSVLTEDSLRKPVAVERGLAATRLAELVGRLSLAFDAANDAAPGRAVRSTLLAVELGKRAGLNDDELRDGYWQTLLGYLVGPGGHAPRTIRSDTSPLDRSRPPKVLDRLLQRWGTEVGSLHLEGMAISRQLERLARLVENAHRRGGGAEALDLVRQRAGIDFEARFANVFLDEHGALLRALEDSHAFERFMELEPGPVEWADDRGVDDVARALALFVELEVPTFLGHSNGVAALAERAASELGLPAEEVRMLRLAAFLHDIGRASVPNAIWTRPGPLAFCGWERVRLHPYYTRRVLAPIDALAGVAEIAAAAHERMDGSGYPQCRAARNLSCAARVLAAADVAFAMSEHRPHRPALHSDTIARELVAEADRGRLDARAVDAVLASLGLPDRAAPNVHGLSERELDVSHLLARGKSDKEIGAALHISPRTVQVHVARILDKLGVRSRAGAAIWLIEHDLAN